MTREGKFVVLSTERSVENRDPDLFPFHGIDASYVMARTHGATVVLVAFVNQVGIRLQATRETGSKEMPACTTYVMVSKYSLPLY